MPHPVRQMRLRKQRREHTEEFSSTPVQTNDTHTNSKQEYGNAPETSVSGPSSGSAVRLHKIMADHGLGSRRGLEDAIREGKIIVNGKVAQIGQTVQPSDQIHFEGRLIKLHFGLPTFPRVLMYHKPSGEIVSRDDPEGREDVFERLPQLEHGRWISIGRLDLNSEGLLLFTDSGELAHRLMHPRHDIEREYAVRVYGVLTGEQCRKLLQGVQLEDGPARIMSLRDQGGEGANHWYHVVLKDGRYREVRRIFAALDLTVSRLIRVRYANLPMPSTLKRGDLEELSQDQVTRLMRIVNMFPSDFNAAAKHDGANIVPFEAKRSNHRDHHRSGRYDKPRQHGHSSQGHASRGGSYYEDRKEAPNGQRGYQARRPKEADTSFSRNSRLPHLRHQNKMVGHLEGGKPIRSSERYPSKPSTERPFIPNPGLDAAQEEDFNLKSGGGRHPFKRYSQRRIMSYQREDGSEYEARSGSSAPGSGGNNGASGGYHSNKKQDEDALLQQRYAELERKGQLRGLAGQTLGGQDGQNRQELDGNRLSYNSRPRERGQYNRGGQGYPTGNNRESRDSRFANKPLSFSKERFNEQRSHRRQPDGFQPSSEPQYEGKSRDYYSQKPYGSETRGASPYKGKYGGERNRQFGQRDDHKREQEKGYPRTFHKKSFKKD